MSERTPLDDDTHASTYSMSLPRCSSSSSDALAPTTSSGSSEPTADEEKILQLTWMDVIGTVVADVTPEAEPTSGTAETPVFMIDYSPDFSFVLGLYRGARPQMRALLALPRAALHQRLFGSHCAMSSSAMAQWLLLLGYTVRQCMAHYTAWADRRELIFHPQAFWAATRERVQFHLRAFDPAGSTGAAAADRGKQEKKLSDLNVRLATTCGSWLPGKADLPAEVMAAIADAGSGEGEGHDIDTALSASAVWHAIAWEMETVGCVARMYHKNFQIWHHRKELLSYGLDRLVDVELSQPRTSALSPEQVKAARRAALTEIMDTKESFCKRLEEKMGVPFERIDERIVTSTVLENVDSKNYHAWLHRSGFIHTFSFLVKGPSALCWRQDWLRYCSDKTPLSTPLQIDASWATERCLRVAAAPEGTALREEFDYTAKCLKEDCFNNSAWCHRVYLLREDVVAALLARYEESLRDGQSAVESSAASDASPSALSLEELLTVLQAVCKEEVDFGLQWAAVQPCNESAFVYARSAAELYQSAVLRLRLHAAMTAEGRSQPDSRVLLRDRLCAPTAAACTGYIIDHEDAASSVDAPVVGASSTHRRAGQDIAQYFMSAQRHVPWSAYIDSFALLQYQQDFLHTVVIPKVTAIENDVHVVLSELQQLGNTIEDKDELLAARQQKLQLLYDNGSQYMLNNLHQARSALYHSIFSFLEQTWLLYWNEKARMAVEAARSPASYAEAGVTDEMLPPEVWGHSLQTCKSLSEADHFLEKEAMALFLAKRLAVEDGIRAKYWRNEARTVMLREY